MQAFDGDPFLDEFQTLVEQVRADDLAHAAHLSEAAMIRDAWARKVAHHIFQRSTELASMYRRSDQAVEYTGIELPDDQDLPATHTLHCRVTRPFRKLKATISLQTGRYRFRLPMTATSPGGSCTRTRETTS